MEEFVLKGKTLLVVDDEVDLREIVASELEYMGATVFQAENVSVAKSIYKEQQIDLIVSDIRMPGGTGIDLLNFVKGQSGHVPPIILITGFADITVEDAFNQGAEALLSKPFKLEELIRVSVKLTSSVAGRYRSTPEPTDKDLEILFSEKLNQKIHSHDLAIGRGGLALTVDSMNFKWDTGDVINFSFKFSDIELKGTAVCRWWKPQAHLNKVVLGLEFTQLSLDTLKYLQSSWSQQQDQVAFIPSL